MWRAGRLFTFSPVTLSDKEAVPMILEERMFIVEDLGRDVPPVDVTGNSGDQPAVAPSSRKRRR